MVALGIFLSRVAGLIRDRVFAHFFGNGMAADAFRAAFRIPNLLQNLFGEGALSASFIPVYARLRAEGKEEQARVVASGVAAVLALLISLLVLVGILMAPLLVSVIAPGFGGEKRLLTVKVVRLLFPGAGLLVWSAWCLGILNSHRRFLLSYTAPVFWNLMVILALLFFGRYQGEKDLAVTCALASVVGSAVQLGVQLPFALRLAGKLKAGLFLYSAEVRRVVRNFLPAFFSRGVFQLSTFIDSLLASLLPTGALAAMTYAQTLYVLPVSLFGMSVSASELPQMSEATGSDDEVAAKLRQRLHGSLERISFFVVPSMVAFLVLGDVIVAAIYQTGRFGREDVLYVWVTLAGASLGLLAATQGRLLSSAFFALQDTMTPFRCAVAHVVVSAGLGTLAALFGPGLIGVEEKYGVAGITMAAGLGCWVELVLLRIFLRRRIGRTELSWAYSAKVGLSAALSAAAAFGLKLVLPPVHPILSACAVLSLFAVLYFGLTMAFGVDEARALINKVIGRIRGRRKQGERRER